MASSINSPKIYYYKFFGRLDYNDLNLPLNNNIVPNYYPKNNHEIYINNFYYINIKINIKMNI